MEERRNGGGSMNIITDEVEDIAELVKLRMTRGRVSYTVYADNDGKVILDRTHDPRRAMPVPDRFLVGVYTRRAEQADIAADLLARREELAA